MAYQDGHVHRTGQARQQRELLGVLLQLVLILVLDSRISTSEMSV